MKPTSYIARAISVAVLALSFAAAPAFAAGSTAASRAAQAVEPAGHEEHAEQPAPRERPWPKSVLDLAARLPIQQGGRVKPLSTFAAFTLLRLNGKRSIVTDDGTRLDPTAWLLDVLYDPARALHYEVFLVQDAQVIEALGLSHQDKKRRDRYSYLELEPGLDRLMQLAHEYDRIEPKRRSSLEEQVVNLAENVLAFVRINRHETLALFPPWAPIEHAGEEAWWSPPEMAGAAGSAEGLPAQPAALFESFKRLGALRLDDAAFERELRTLQQGTTSMAAARGEGAKVAAEVAYYEAKPITWSLVSFLAAFLLAAVLWLRPNSRWLHRACVAFTLLGSLLLLCAIGWRCFIRSRPPVSTLYETVIFVTCTGALVALAVEWIHRNRIAVSAAAVLGTIGLFVANGYETLDKQDTMPSLVAVLDTNFWLATHVTAITIGYSGGMLAALLASIYLVAKALGLRRADPSFYRSLGRMVYGVVCFAVIFSTVGTILGGIWANESWGRFWGWDPKENGALLIVISQLVILHARLGGYLREHGVCMASAFGGTVVAFSWWGVNLLGVGLHSYGFTSGIHRALWSYYFLQWGIVGLGAWSAWRARRALPSASALQVDPDGPRAALPQALTVASVPSGSVTEPA